MMYKRRMFFNALKSISNDEYKAMPDADRISLAEGNPGVILQIVNALKAKSEPKQPASSTA